LSFLVVVYAILNNLHHDLLIFVYPEIPSYIPR